MGFGGLGWRHFNAVHKAQMGWVRPERQRAVSASGIYSLLPVETDPEALGLQGDQVLTIGIPNTSSRYYVSYRMAADGYSINLDPVYRNKLSIHRRDATGGYSYFVASIGAGSVFNDGKGTSILFRDAAAIATLEISLPGGPVLTTGENPGATTPAATPTPFPTPIGALDPPASDPALKKYSYIGTVRIIKGRRMQPVRRLIAELKDLDTGLVISAKWNAAGRFRFLVPAGRYRLRVLVKSADGVSRKVRSVSIPDEMRSRTSLSLGGGTSATFLLERAV